MKKRFSYEQIISILREAEAGELCRKHTISDTTFYTLCKKYGGMEKQGIQTNLLLKEESYDDWLPKCDAPQRYNLTQIG